MERETQNEKKPGASAPQKTSKLFRVLVVGGVLLAAALASTAMRGATGVAQNDDDGGVQGW